MERPARRLVALLLVLGLVVGPAAAAAGTAQTQPAADNTVTRVQVYENGTARWSIQVRTRLETADEVDRFRAFQDRLREDRQAALDRFRDRMTGVVAAAQNATGREMAARAFALSTHVQEVPQRWGVVTYAFTWTGFAARDGTGLVVGDVFEGGFFLAADDRFIVVEPAGYRVAAVDPAPDTGLEDAVSWDGRRDFADGRPRVRLEPEPASTAAAGPASPATTARPVTHSPTPAGGLSTGTVAGLAVLGLLVLGGLGLVARRRGSLGGDPGGSGPLTDAERVQALLAERGGQLKQTEIDDAVDWSSSKTSRVLSRMAEAGTVEKLRIGRENVIRLPEDGPED